ncbi:unnamed protein product [Didymodactylos carnosus]|uniref:Thiamin pyrophosphokinase thiamin-binding domain-containing protein n=1 Tax=Didymodactylos carnosus TaxID=1234261 RepID=A0A815ZG38_9BILA|nr:unnamed protein product [Didymodactylos carnosus]CAF1581796.1 unnamed protein product [Didymodactylos carnosus]CAF4154494.1 unnamed protein product [Didymodactylos carnosus]CAF4449833.1 unnamed protein product [Didymodactylos carnosus]
MTKYSNDSDDIIYDYYPYSIGEKDNCLSVLPYGIIILNYSHDSLKTFLTKSIWSRAIIRGCADGGSNVLREFSEKYFDHQLLTDPFMPDYISGDMDSISEKTKIYYSSGNVKFIETINQSETDFTKCVRTMLQQCERLDVIYVFSSLCGRFDHAMGNIHTLYLINSLNLNPKLRLYLVTDQDITFLLKSGHNRIHTKSQLRGRECSLLPFAYPTRVRTDGLKWNLNNDTELNFSTLVSTSNTYDERNTKDYVEIYCEKPVIYSMTYKINKQSAS